MSQSASFRRAKGRAPSNGNRVRTSPPSRTQTFDSSGPDVRIRGNAWQIFEKYVSLARDATASGNRVHAEGYYQHAEHYFRLHQEAVSANPPIQRVKESDPNWTDDGEGEAAKKAEVSLPSASPSLRVSPTPPPPGESGKESGFKRRGQSGNGRSRGRNLRYPPMAANIDD